MPAVLGDFLAAASEHLEAAVVVGDGQVTELPAVARDLHRLVAVMSHCLEDLTPCDAVEASFRDDLHAWERAVIDAGAALHTAAACLRRSADEPGDQAVAAVSWRARHLAAAATQLAAGRDLLHTHLGSDPGGLTRDRSEWGLVVTSLPVTRALAYEVARWAQQLAPFAAWLAGSATSYALRRAPDQDAPAAVRDELASASQWLQVASAAVRPALDADPVRTTDTDLLDAIPAAAAPRRHRPDAAGESVTELCYGISISASRLRAAARGSQERARWSPGTTSGGWQWMAQAAAVTSHLSELALRSLSIRAGQLSGLPVTGAQLRDAADRMADMRAAWQQVDRTWDLLVTESRLLQTPAMTEASDLVLRLGRLVWDNPRWTPARSDRAPQRTPAALAPGAAAVNSVAAAAHQAVDALARVAMTDLEAVEAADRAGRLYVPTRSLSADYNVPRPFAPAPAARFRVLRDAYRAAVEASIEAAHVLDELTVAARGPSMALALARAAASVQSHRRSRLDKDDPRDPLPADTPFGHSRASTGHAGPLEQAIRDRRVYDTVILLRAAAIDDAARRLMDQAVSAIPQPGGPDTPESTQRSARGPAELAAQSFPHDPVTGPSAGNHPIRPDTPALPAARAATALNPAGGAIGHRPPA